MKNYLIELDHSRCRAFIREQLERIGNLINAVVMNNEIQGKFYCIANDNLDPDQLYELTTAIGQGPWPEKLVINFITSYLNSTPNSYRNLVIENWSTTVNDSWFKEDCEYFLSKDMILYCIGTGSNREAIKEVFHKTASPWASGFFPILVEADLTRLELHKNITPETTANILQGLTMFFMGIYDNESYLVWIREDMQHLIKLLEKHL